MKPKLTRSRWLTLKKLAKVQDTAFTSIETGVHGSALLSLAECGWLEQAKPPKDKPFEIATRGNHWRVTTTGREVIAALPSEPPRRT